MNARTAAAVAVAAVAAAGPGHWRPLPPAPVAIDDGYTSVWTGSRMLVFGRVTSRATDGAVLSRRDAAASYDPGSNTWRRLPAPPASTSFMGRSSVWTGKEMLVWGQGIREAFDPATNRWRRLPSSPLLSIHDGYGLVAWTGRELIGWGGGCGGDAFSDGVAYSPSTNRWRALARSPLAGSQEPIGAWTGRELIVFVGNVDPDGKPWPARFARAAAYNPATDTWRRIAPLPALHGAVKAVWDGHELLVVAGAGGAAYDPATNRWRRLAPIPSARQGAAVVWAGTRLLVWGGRPVPRGFAYDPKLDRWSRLPAAPLRGRLDPTAVWTGRTLIVWGGTTGRPPYRGFADGAVLTP